MFKCFNISKIHKNSVHDYIFSNIHSLLLPYVIRPSVKSNKFSKCSDKHKQRGSFDSCNFKFRSKHNKLTCWKSWQNDLMSIHRGLLVVCNSQWYSLDLKSIQRFVPSLFMILSNYCNAFIFKSTVHQLNFWFKIQMLTWISSKSISLSTLVFFQDRAVHVLY
jgi:hypothetical protein